MNTQTSIKLHNGYLYYSDSDTLNSAFSEAENLVIGSKYGIDIDTKNNIENVLPYNKLFAEVLGNVLVPTPKHSC